jgi:hypothetical protein
MCGVKAHVRIPPASFDVRTRCMYTSTVDGQQSETRVDAANIGHVARHGIAPAEAEEAVLNRIAVLATVLSGGEERMVCAGRTASGRVLKAVYTLRRGRIRVVTAHEDRKLPRIL